MDLSNYKYPRDGYHTADQIAELRGVTPKQIYYDVQTGKLKGCYIADERGKMIFMLDKVKEAYEVPSIRQQTAQARKDDASGGPENREAQNYTKARTGNEILKLQKAQLELEELKGSLIPVDKVKSDTFILARTTRDQLLAIPERVSAIFASESEEAKIHDMLKAEIRSALKTIEEVIEQELGHGA